MAINPDNVLLFSLTSSPKLAKEVTERLGMELSPCTVSHFADGEFFARPDCSVKGKKCYVIQSTCNPVSERLFELLVFIDALKNAQAKEINLVIPYYGYARQDRIVHRGEPVTAKMTAKILEAAGASKVITLDIHSQQTSSFFNIPVDDLSASKVFADYYKRLLPRDGIPFESVCVVSPDHGGVHRAKKLSEALKGSTMAVMDKRRERPNIAEIVNVIGEVKGKACIIADDMIDTGGTILSGVKALFSCGASSVYVCATHGVFSRGAEAKLLSSGIKDLAITNTIERDGASSTVLSIAPMIADLIESDLGHRDVPVEYMAFY